MDGTQEIENQQITIVTEFSAPTAEIVERNEPVYGAQCVLVSRIGQPIDQPQIVELRVGCQSESVLQDLKPPEIVHDQLHGVDRLWEKLLSGEVAFDRWPFLASSAR